ncbi:MAG: NAD-dependent epimerase/dehydratase family protein [Planctomycetes bacterium]|nr:NAD-dependent epimerase/dehydratase family protein [Planctomycetota bacterium]MCW8135054.1 NAD-dependent epimerase/dehydratase family protein [Planctomycetota bacterium]
MKLAFVTGTSGFIGSAVARELLADGVAVRVLMRKGADHKAIKGLDVEVIEGDLTDASALAKGLVGADACFHVAGMNAISLRGRGDIRRIYEANERGAAMVLRTAAEAGCTRIVHTSTVAVLRQRADGTPSHEGDLAPLDELTVHYQRSKWLGEQKALELAKEGAPVVIASPSAPMGPCDVKPTPTGRVVLDFLLGKMPGYMETGLNVIDVQDCARGHILAAQKGKPGERYILSHENLQIRAIFETLAEVTGLPAPKFKVPKTVAIMAAAASEMKARFTGKAPVIPLAGVRMALKPMWYDNTRALTELGLPTRPVRETLRRAAQWYVQHGYAPAPPKALD